MGQRPDAVLAGELFAAVGQGGPVLGIIIVRAFRCGYVAARVGVAAPRFGCEACLREPLRFS